LCKITARLGPGVKRLPFAAIHHAMCQPLWGRFDL
jgi:hypothetical protein